MSLARTNSPLNKLIIRNLGDVGGPQSGLVDAELDNIIAWAKLSPRCIHVNTAATGNVGTGLDNLHSFSLAANSLATDGDWVRVRYGGTYANSEADKQIQVSIDGQVSISFGGTIDMENGNWYVDLTYVRTSSTGIRVAGFDNHVQFRMADGAIVVAPSGSFHAVRNASLTVSNLNSNAVTLLVKGETTAAVDNEVVQNFSVIELFQQ